MTTTKALYLSNFSLNSIIVSSISLSIILSFNSKTSFAVEFTFDGSLAKNQMIFIQKKLETAKKNGKVTSEAEEHQFCERLQASFLRLNASRGGATKSQRLKNNDPEKYQQRKQRRKELSNRDTVLETSKQNSVRDEDSTRKRQLQWEQVKNDPVKYQNYKDCQKRYREKLKNDPLRYAQRKEKNRLRREKIKVDPEKLAQEREKAKAAYERIKNDPEKYAHYIRRQSENTRNRRNLAREMNLHKPELTHLSAEGIAFDLTEIVQGQPQNAQKAQHDHNLDLDSDEELENDLMDLDPADLLAVRALLQINSGELETFIDDRMEDRFNNESDFDAENELEKALDAAFQNETDEMCSPS